MTRVSVDIVIDASAGDVWSYVEHIDRHVEWMTDATAIHFHGEQRSGVGTRFTCDTKIGPLRLRDEMEITRWEPQRAMGVRHDGIATGAGTFLIEPVDATSTRFRWDEELTLPWYFGGRLASPVSARVLAAVWRRNLRSLKRRVEDEPPNRQPHPQPDGQPGSAAGTGGRVPEVG